MDVYVMKDGKRLGPWQPFRLVEMLEDGELTPRDLIWHEGMDEWLPMEEAESMRTVLRRQPPAVSETDTAGEPPEPASPGPPPLPRTDEAPVLTLQVLASRKAAAWRRFFAKQIDLTLLMLAIVGIATAAGWTDLWAIHRAPLAILFAPGIALILLDSLLLPLTGWTPGRLILGQRVLAEDGGRLSFKQALRRSVLLWAGGLGFGLPFNALLPPAQWLYSFWQFQRQGETLWDRAAKSHVEIHPLRAPHVTGVIAVTALVAAVNALVLFRAPLPDRIEGEERALILQMRRAGWDAVLDKPPPGS